MAITVRRLEPALGMMLAKCHNTVCAQTALVGALFHADLTSLTTTDQYLTGSAATLQVTAATASDASGGPYTTCIALTNNLIGVINVMMKDGASTDPYAAGAHKIPDTVNLALMPAQYTTSGNNATDLAALITSANLIKSTYNAHCSQTGVHYNNDGTNTIAASNAVDQPSLQTLLNAAKTAVNAHIASAPATPMIKVIGP